MQIQAEEQQQLLAHSRAITEALPEEINLIAVGQSGQGQQWNNSPPMLPAKVIAFPIQEAVASDAAPTNLDERDQELRASFSSSPISASSNQAQLMTDDCTLMNEKASVPTDSDGFAENPDAYKVWKPQPVEGEPLQPVQLKEKLAVLTQNLTMPKLKEKPQMQPKNELEESKLSVLDADDKAIS